MRVLAWIFAIWIAIGSCVLLMLALPLVREGNPLGLFPLLLASLGFFGSIGLLRKWPWSRSAAAIILVGSAYGFVAQAHQSLGGRLGPSGFWAILFCLGGLYFLRRDYQRTPTVIGPPPVTAKAIPPLVDNPTRAVSSESSLEQGNELLHATPGEGKMQTDVQWTLADVDTFLRRIEQVDLSGKTTEYCLANIKHLVKVGPAAIPAIENAMYRSKYSYILGEAIAKIGGPQARQRLEALITQRISAPGLDYDMRCRHPAALGLAHIAGREDRSLLPMVHDLGKTNGWMEDINRVLAQYDIPPFETWDVILRKVLPSSYRQGFVPDFPRIREAIQHLSGQERGMVWNRVSNSCSTYCSDGRTPLSLSCRLESLIVDPSQDGVIWKEIGNNFYNTSVQKALYEIGPRTLLTTRLDAIEQLKKVIPRIQNDGT